MTTRLVTIPVALSLMAELVEAPAAIAVSQVIGVGNAGREARHGVSVGTGVAMGEPPGELVVAAPNAGVSVNDGSDGGVTLAANVGASPCTRNLPFST